MGPQRMEMLATRMAMAGKIQDEQVVVVEGLSFDEPKTKEMAGMLNGMGLAGKSALIATAGYEPAIYKSARNIQGVKVSNVEDLNALEILRPDRLVISREAIDQMKEKAAAAAKK